ncbi:MAG: quinone-dependent dihydroorotate dehydrogenase [Rikenellaceae bacterium]|nr:quinone-dependent dihydroorotate dehydrogenase [Rikenellaceae bacterium]
MLYQKVIKPILFALPIERAHRAVIWLLRLVGWLPGGRWLLRKSYAVEHPSLEREVFGLHFKNPIGLAAGFDVNGDIFRELEAMGFGFVEIGTVTPKPQSGNPRPRVFRLQRDCATINRLGLPNLGLEYALNRLRGDHRGIIVGCNIGCNLETPPEKVPADYLKVFRNLYQYADYFTVNINCDNGTEESVAPSTERLMQILNPLFDFRRGQNQYRPILLKISPDLTNEEVDRMADVMISTPLDGIVAVSGTNRRTELDTSIAALAKVGSGRLGGSPLRKRALEVVRRVHDRARGTYPIIGVGGIFSPDDVRAMLDAGASLVQLYSGFIYEGPRVAGDLCRAMIPAAESVSTSAEPVSSPAEPTDIPTTSK